MASKVLLFDLLTERGLRRERVFRDRTNVLDSLDDIDIMSRYRFPRKVILELTEKVKPHIEKSTRRSHAIPAHIYVLCTLRYLAKGGFLSEIGDIHGVSRSSVSRIIHTTTVALIDVLQLVKFPTDTRPVMEAFHDLCGFPRVIGCVDGTLIPIQAPYVEEVAYVSRKGFHAINVQAICDAQLRFTNTVAAWPGSTHDSHIFNVSDIKKYLENANQTGWLLGDSGYGCKSYLLTPLANPRTPSEERYNRAHCGTRNTVERAFGVCKSRFRCLHRSSGCLLFQPERCVNVIAACFQLHNLAINLKLPQPREPLPTDEGEVEGEDRGPDHQHCGTQDGQAVRRHLIETRFSN